MYLKCVRIDNFRNIKHFESELNMRCAFLGKNFTGKTNSILAIYWLFTDFLLDGSQDLATIKPTYDTTKEVAVKVILDDDTSIEKKYAENWVKTKGSDVQTLVGHITNIYINDVKQPSLTIANELIKEKLGLANNPIKTLKIDVIKMLLNPFYLAEQVDWKDLRNFVIELVGNVSDEEVYKYNPSLIIIKDLLTKNFNQTDLAVKYCQQQIKNLKTELLKLSSLIDQLSTIKDAEPAAINQAISQSEVIDEKIAQLLYSITTMRNPRINELESIINSLIEVKNESIEQDRKNSEQENHEVFEQLNHLNKIYNELVIEVAKQGECKNKIEQETNSLKVKIMDNCEKIKFNKSRVYDLKNKLELIKSRNFLGYEIPPYINCPHCGGIINEEVVNNAKTKLEADNQKFKLQLENELSTVSSEIQRINKEIETYDSDNIKINHILSIKEVEMNKFKNIEVKNQQISDINQQIENTNLQLKIYKPSEKTINVNEQINILKTELAFEKTKNYTYDIEKQVRELKLQKNQYEALIRKHYLYLDTQVMIKEKYSLMLKLQNQLNELENQLMLIEEFVKTKLNMLDNNVEKVFANIKFKLIENNIKEGSYSETCHPIIIGKDTQFVHGSTSEKIITGIAIIEAVRKHLNLPSLPIIFDGAESLDNDTLLNRLNTTSQIISTKVDDNSEVCKVIDLN